jgi:hypothetical protein
MYFTMKISTSYEKVINGPQIRTDEANAIHTPNILLFPA